MFVDQESARNDDEDIVEIPDTEFAPPKHCGSNSEASSTRARSHASRSTSASVPPTSRTPSQPSSPTPALATSAAKRVLSSDEEPDVQPRPPKRPHKSPDESHPPRAKSDKSKRKSQSDRGKKDKRDPKDKDMRGKAARDQLNQDKGSRGRTESAKGDHDKRKLSTQREISQVTHSPHS